MSRSSSSSITATYCLQANASIIQKFIWSIESQNHGLPASNHINNTVIPLIIKHGSISIQNIRSTVSTLIERFTILRTALYFDESRGHLLQAVQPLMGNDNYSFELTNSSQPTNDEITTLIEKEVTNRFARLDQGLVVRCHLIKMTLDGDAEHLKSNDMILFVFHPMAFNHHSIKLFLDAFETIYNQTKASLSNSQYIDFTFYQYALFNSTNQLTKVNEARQFWLKLLHDYNPDGYSSLSSSSTQNYRTMFNLDVNLTAALTEFAVLHNVSMMQLGLTCFMCFLYEFSNCTLNDLCVAVSTDEQPLIEMKTMISPYFDIQPYRIQFNSKHSLTDILKLISQMNISIGKYDQFPYLLLMNNINNALNLAQLPFNFQYYFQDPSLTEVISLKSNTDEADLGVYTDRYLLNKINAASNGVTLIMLDNHDNQTIQFILDCSTNYHDQATSFENFLTQMFTKDLTTNGFEQTVQPIAKKFLHPQVDNGSQEEIVEISNQETSDKVLFKTSSSEKMKAATDTTSNDELKNAIANIWQDVIYTDRFNSSSYNSQETMHSSSDPFSNDTDNWSSSTSTLNFSSLGGDSLQFVQVYQRYQLLFNLDVNQLPTRSLFEHNTIDEHVKLIAPMMKDKTESQQWRTLHINMGKVVIRSHLSDICHF